MNNVYTCHECRQLWPGEILKLAAWRVNGRAEAILLCPTCQAKQLDHNPNYSFLSISKPVREWLIGGGDSG